MITSTEARTGKCGVISFAQQKIKPPLTMTAARSLTYGTLPCAINHRSAGCCTTSLSTPTTPVQYLNNYSAPLT